MINGTMDLNLTEHGKMDFFLVIFFPEVRNSSAGWSVFCKNQGGLNLSLHNGRGYADSGLERAGKQWSYNSLVACNIMKLTNLKF